MQALKLKVILFESCFQLRNAQAQAARLSSPCLGLITVFGYRLRGSALPPSPLEALCKVSCASQCMQHTWRSAASNVPFSST